MHVPSPIRRTLPLTAIAASIAAVIVIAVLAGRSQLAEYLGENLDQVSESEVPPRIQQLVELGEPGTAELTKALNSDQSAVAQAAEAALFKQMNHWKTLDADQASPKVAHLFRQLAKRSPQYGPRAREAAADLAEEALDWQPGKSSVDRAQLISDCALLLRADATDRKLTQPSGSYDLFADSQLPSPPPQPDDHFGSFQAHQPTSTDNTESPEDQSVPLPDRDQPPKVARGTVTLRASPPRSVPAPTKTVPQTFTESSEEDTRGTPDQPPARLDPPLTRPVPWDSRRATTTTSPTARHLSADEADQTTDVRRQDDLSLMRRLHASNPDDAQAARLELVRRGFDARYLRMAEDLTNPDASVRIDFTQTLPAIRDVDVRPWLRTLANDDDAQVRLAAIAVIATLGTPESRFWLRRLQLTEQDPQVQRRLQQILERS